MVDFSLYDEFRTRLGIPWVLLRFHELVTFYCRISLYLKSFVLCNSNNGDGVADRHLDQEEDGGAGVLGERGQIHTG